MHFYAKVLGSLWTTLLFLKRTIFSFELATNVLSLHTPWIHILWGVANVETPFVEVHYHLLRSIIISCNICVQFINMFHYVFCRNTRVTTHNRMISFAICELLTPPSLNFTLHMATNNVYYFIHKNKLHWPLLGLLGLKRLILTSTWSLLY